MATIQPQRAKVSGTAITYAAASGGGDKFKPGQHREYRVKNGHSSAQSVTIAVPGNTKYGAANPDIGPVSIAAGVEFTFGPFDVDLGDSDDGMVDVTYSGVTALTVAVVDV
jgi:hypothetical protein